LNKFEERGMKEGCQKINRNEKGMKSNALKKMLRVSRLAA